MMSRAYTNRPKAETAKEPVDASFVAAVQRGLGWNDVRVVGRALLASRIAVDGSKPDESVMDAALGLGNRADFAGGAPRHGLLQFAVTNAVTRRPKEVVALLTESLSAREPFVLEYALRELARGRVMDDAPLVVARTTPLLKHPDPVVRGAASELLGKRRRGTSAPPRSQPRWRPASRQRRRTCGHRLRWHWVTSGISRRLGVSQRYSMIPPWQKRASKDGRSSRGSRLFHRLAPRRREPCEKLPCWR
jgi:hypothetical protein